MYKGISTFVIIILQNFGKYLLVAWHNVLKDCNKLLFYNAACYKSCLKCLSATFHIFWNIFTNNSNKLYCLCTHSYTANNTTIFQHTHGGPQDEIRHAGDFGNIWAYENGTASDQIPGTLISLYPDSEGYAVGRAFVVHAGTDDLGRGGNEESLKTGNAGGRLACCVVVAVN